MFTGSVRWVFLEYLSKCLLELFFRDRLRQTRARMTLHEAPRTFRQRPAGEEYDTPLVSSTCGLEREEELHPVHARHSEITKDRIVT